MQVFDGVQVLRRSVIDVSQGMAIMVLSRLIATSRQFKDFIQHVANIFAASQGERFASILECILL